MLKKSKLLLAFMPFMLASCGTKYTTQVRFGVSPSQLCHDRQCLLDGYDSNYGTTRLYIIITGSETITLKASNISITCSNGETYTGKGFATLGDSEYPNRITSVNSEFKFTSNSEEASELMFDKKMADSYLDVNATMKINNTTIPFYTLTSVTFYI